MRPICYKCPRDLEDGPLYRVNPKGEVPAIWACRDHVPVLPAPELLQLCEIIHQGNK